MTPSGKLSIGYFSRLSRLSIRMIRYYGERGMLAPAYVDPSTGYRYYSGDQLEEAAHIRLLRDLGYPVGQMAAILPLFADPDALGAELDRQRLRLSGEAARLAQQIDEVETLITALKETAMSIVVNTIDVPAYTAASLRDTIGAYSDEGVLWARLMESMPAGVRFAGPDGPPLAVAVFHDEEYREADVDVEVRMSVAQPFADAGDVHCVEVPAHRAVSAILKGGFDGIGAVSEALGHAVADRNLEIAGPMYNVYVVGPETSKDTSDWVTDVRIPVQ